MPCFRLAATISSSMIIWIELRVLLILSSKPIGIFSNVGACFGVFCARENITWDRKEHENQLHLNIVQSDSIYPFLLCFNIVNFLHQFLNRREKLLLERNGFAGETAVALATGPDLHLHLEKERLMEGGLVFQLRRHEIRSIAFSVRQIGHIRLRLVIRNCREKLA